MSKSRIKTPATTIQNREEMESLVGEITKLKIYEQTVTARMNSSLAVVREKYEADLAEIADALKGRMALARDWAEAHPSDFGKGRSIAMTHGVVGWRLGNPTLKTRPRWTWKLVLEKIKELGLDAFIRVKQEVDKETILAARGDETAEHVFKAIGVQVVQDESFYIEPRIETPESRMQEATP